MASAQRNTKYAGKTDKEIYDAAIEAVPAAGLKVWKTRELARLVIANGEVDGSEVRCNIVVSMVDNSTTITAESDDLDQAQLEKVAASLQQALDAVLV